MASAPRGKVVGIVQARMSSARLPGKVLAPLLGRPLLEVLVRRLASAPVDAWWLATSTEPDDDLLAERGRALGLEVFRGDLEDVLSRYTAVIGKSQADWIVRVTADDPFMDGRTLASMLEQLDRSDPPPDLLWDRRDDRFFPLGYLPQVARAEAVLACAASIPDSEPWHRGHVLSWIDETGRVAVFEPPASWPARPHWRWTVDEPEDLTMARAAFELFAESWCEVSYLEMVATLDAHPEVCALNAGVAQKTLEEG